MLYLFRRSPFDRLGSPGTIREVPGGSLHTFSPERKYDFPVMLAAGASPPPYRKVIAGCSLPPLRCLCG